MKNPLGAGGGPAGHTRKHSASHGSKHKHSARKHSPPTTQGVISGGGGGPVHVVSKPAHHPKPRQWSPGSDVACCSAQAVGTLLGWNWQQVLEVYWRTASDPDIGATITDTLQAGRGDWSAFETDYPAALSYPRAPAACPASLILGVTLPEPHAVAVTPYGTWWSWGAPFDPFAWPELVIEEAWAVLP